jgi:hypothetical protein
MKTDMMILREANHPEVVSREVKVVLTFDAPEWASEYVATRGAPLALRLYVGEADVQDVQAKGSQVEVSVMCSTYLHQGQIIPQIKAMFADSLRLHMHLLKIDLVGADLQ